jgi:anaerobic selenocysteine-containing dehydrogenase
LERIRSIAMSGGIPHANPARRLERAQARGPEADRDRSATQRDRQASRRSISSRAGLGSGGPRRRSCATRDRARISSTPPFVAEHVAGLEILEQKVARFTPEFAAARSDVRRRRRSSRRRGSSAAHAGAPCTAGTGVNMSGWSNLTEYLLLCLNAVCGRYRRAGDRVANPGVLTTRRDFKAQVLPPYKIDGYGKPLRSRPDLPPAVCGLPTSALADEILLEGEDRVRALITIGGNPMRAWPDPIRTKAALERLELHVVVEPRWTDTAQLADFVLAPKLPLETPGSTLSTENLFTVSPALGYSEPYGQYAAPIVAPPEGSELLEDWEFFYGLAQRMGLALDLLAHCYGEGPDGDDEQRGATERAEQIRALGSSTGRLVDNLRDFDPYTGIPRMSAIPVSLRRA